MPIRGVFFAKKITPRQHSSAVDSAFWLAQLWSVTGTIGRKAAVPH